MQQQLTVLDTFHPLCDHLATKCPGQADHGRGQGQVITVVNNVAHKGLVDLDGLGAQALEVTQG
ncbi:hypothetical protein D3C80_2097200 [compost metagenome]